MHSGLDGGEMHLRRAHQLQPAAERKSLSIPRFLQYYAEIMHAKKGLLMVTKETRTARASTALHFAHKSPLRKKGSLATTNRRLAGLTHPRGGGGLLPSPSLSRVGGSR